MGPVTMGSKMGRCGALKTYHQACKTCVSELKSGVVCNLCTNASQIWVAVPSGLFSLAMRIAEISNFPVRLICRWICLAAGRVRG